MKNIDVTASGIVGVPTATAGPITFSLGVNLKNPAGEVDIYWPVENEKVYTLSPVFNLI